MPNLASTKKRLRQDQVRRLRNRSAKASVRTQVKKVRQAIEAGELEKSEAEFKACVKKLDKAAAKGLLHANAAARTKSRLSKAIKGLKSSAS
ncbi:MAG: 30S ribosomal protein S20 [Planctomycetales bacterium]|nr:30S ribosomal protein S20 [Planctomycetales bacterium]